jgi:serine/threonine protein kinase
VKLGDFGMTKRVAGESSVLHTEVGTRAFRAPEIMDPDVDSYTNAVDMLRALDVSHSLTAQME